MSLPLAWMNVYSSTTTFAMIVHDSDASAASSIDDVSHWLIFNAPGLARSLPAGIATVAELSDDSIHGRYSGNTFRLSRHGDASSGPYHHYTFELFAVDRQLVTGAN